MVRGLEPLPCKEKLGEVGLKEHGQEKSLGDLSSSPTLPTGRLLRRWS